jgi:hypothetical protein
MTRTTRYEEDEGNGPSKSKSISKATSNEDAVEPPPLARGDDGEEDDDDARRGTCDGDVDARREEDDRPSSLSSSSGSDDEDDDDNDDVFDGEEDEEDDKENDDGDDGPSEYERLRLNNIRRNRERLAMLGLLPPSENDNNDSAWSSSDAAAASARKRKRSSAVATAPTRSLPRRRCARVRSLVAVDGDDDVDVAFQGRVEDGVSKRRMVSSAGGRVDDYDRNDYDDLESLPSPVPVTRVLRPQPHQAELDEAHLSHHLRTRRSRRGRPRRGEYVYGCDEACARCGGGWRFDNICGAGIDEDEDNNVGERTRLIRCKDCRGAFHVGCMLVHGGDDAADVDVFDGGDGEGRDGERATTADTETNVVVDGGANVDAEPSPAGSTRDPIRCHQCDLLRRAGHQRHRSLQQQPPSSSSSSLPSSLPPTSSSSASSSSTPFLLEAATGGRTLFVRVSPEPALEAIVDGQEIVCILSLAGRKTTSTGGENYSPEAEEVEDERGERRERYDANDAIIHCADPAAERQIQKIISKALSNTENARLQDHSCISLRKHLETEASASTVVRLGGIHMLTNAMRSHIGRPTLQAETMNTLAEIVWACDTFPGVGAAKMVRRADEGCLDLVLLAMERHPVHALVQRTACGLFRAMSYDSECCAILKSRRVVSAVSDSIRRNPRKLHVIMEGR